jgi:hypothetical protein
MDCRLRLESGKRGRDMRERVSSTQSPQNCMSILSFVSDEKEESDAPTKCERRNKKRKKESVTPAIKIVTRQIFASVGGGGGSRVRTRNTANTGE